MARGRPRVRQDSIPSHIDQSALPSGIYWDASGSGRWYVIDRVEGVPKKRTVAGPRARLSELHAIVEQRAGVARGTVAWLCDQFHASDKFLELQPRTRKNYDYLRRILVAVPTRVGPLGTLIVDKLSPPFLQRLFDLLARKTPTQANQMQRYLSRVCSYGISRGGCTKNPVAGVEQARERGQRRVPSTSAQDRLIAFAKAGAALQPHTKGSCAPYLWIAAELAYLCQLRGIEVVTLTDANALEDGVRTQRRKGSRDTLFRWSPRLRSAWDAAVAYRKSRIDALKLPTRLRAEERPLFIAEGGGPLSKSALDTAWQRLVHAAIDAGEITAEERFSLHDLKRKGITDYPGTKPEKQLASGHRTASMLEIYDASVPTVDPLDR